MFIAISDVDHDIMRNNCDMERWSYYGCEMENPIFLAETFEQICKCVSRYYYAQDSEYNYCPDYTIYEINRGLWNVKGSRTINIKVDRHDA